MTDQDTSDLTQDEQDLLLAAIQDKRGIVTRIDGVDRLEISSNGRDFTPDGTPYERARWDTALTKLHEKGLLQRRDDKGIVSGITGRGFEVAKSLGL